MVVAMQKMKLLTGQIHHKEQDNDDTNSDAAGDKTTETMQGATGGPP